MPASKLPLEVHLGFLVHDVSRMRRTLFDQAMKPFGVTRSQWWVLSQLSRGGRAGMLQTELARDLDVGKVTVGGLIDRLEAGGYVQRLAVATDRRAKRVVITPLGHEVLAQMVTVGHRLNEIILEGVPKADLAIAARTLELMKDNLRQATLDRDQVDLPVGIEDTEEATRAAGGAAGRPVRSATAR